MATKISSDITPNKRRSFLLNAAAFTVSVFSIGTLMQQPLGKNAHGKSTDTGEQLVTKNIIQPIIHPLAVPRSMRSSK